MTLKVNDTPAFNLAMNLHINYDLEYIEVTVTFRNKEKHTRQTKQFPAAAFSDAIAHYEQLEKMFF